MSACRQMTMPDERAAAVMRTRQFLIRLARSADGFVPDAVRMDAQNFASALPVPGRYCAHLRKLSALVANANERI
jgi:hypothetical protein